MAEINDVAAVPLPESGARMGAGCCSDALSVDAAARRAGAAQVNRYRYDAGSGDSAEGDTGYLDGLIGRIDVSALSVCFRSVPLHTRIQVASNVRKDAPPHPSAPSPPRAPPPAPRVYPACVSVRSCLAVSVLFCARDCPLMQLFSEKELQEQRRSAECFARAEASRSAGAHPQQRSVRQPEPRVLDPAMAKESMPAAVEKSSNAGTAGPPLPATSASVAVESAVPAGADAQASVEAHEDEDAELDALLGADDGTAVATAGTPVPDQEHAKPSVSANALPDDQEELEDWLDDIL